MPSHPVDPTKLNQLLDDLEQETRVKPVPASVPIGAVRRALSHGRLDIEFAQ